MTPEDSEPPRESQGPHEPDEIVDEFLIPMVPGQTEDETDGEDGVAFSAVLGTKDWTVETLVSQMRKGRIDLDPSFQRRNAWLGNRKSKLIESVALGFPIPQIVLAEQEGRPGYYFVLDGKQRLLALRQFFADPSAESDSKFEPLRLSSLEVLKQFNGMDVAQVLQADPTAGASIENHTIRTVVLSGWSSERMLLSLFLRLNTGSVVLSPQELRQALIHGEFVRWLDKTSGDMPALRELLGLEGPDRRMVDAELLLRHIAFTASVVKYRGNLKAFLDDSSRELNRTWAIREGEVSSLATEFGEGISAGLMAFPGGFGRTWRPDHDALVGRYERALNRAVLDVQAYSLSQPEVRRAVVQNAPAVELAYKELCSRDFGFVRSISLTTKTRDAFLIRHRAWRDIVHETTGCAYDLPASLE